jgi:hypothetical protein
MKKKNPKNLDLRKNSISKINSQQITGRGTSDFTTSFIICITTNKYCLPQ